MYMYIYIYIYIHLLVFVLYIMIVVLLIIIGKVNISCCNVLYHIIHNVYIRLSSLASSQAAKTGPLQAIIILVMKITTIPL